uniref:Putative secreted peptide n=1 Tax=Anopheles braziliensis TaxID=58242 RepID=A0A2M3ZN92_9DIPT
MASTVTAVALTVSALLFGFLLSPALLRRFDGAARDRDDEPPPPPPSMVESSSSTSRSPISPSDTSWRCRLDLKCSFRACFRSEATCANTLSQILHTNWPSFDSAK